jgi:hypothetical protein
VQKAGFDGKTEKASLCKACSAERDAEQKGNYWQHCVKSCRQLFGHQSIGQILGCQEDSAKLTEKSSELRASAGEVAEQNSRLNRAQVAKLVREVKAFVSILPRLESALSRLEKPQLHNKDVRD